jgi:hypothetical protein
MSVVSVGERELIGNARAVGLRQQHTRVSSGTRVAETTFGITFDGPALATGRMPVRDLAPALLALGDLFTEASQIVYPDGGPVALSIKATKQGSFEVHLILEAKELWDQVVDIFGSDAVTVLATLENLILGAAGLFALVKKIGGRRIEQEEPAPQPNHVKITLEDGTALEIPTEVAQMYRRISIRTKARDVVAPLKRDGVEQVKFGETSQAPPTLVIEKDDLHAYESAAAEEGDVLLEEEREMVLQIAQVSIEGRKWRLSDGTSPFWASIEDPQFLADIESGEKFAQGDMLRCRVRFIQTRSGAGGLHTDYHVVQVLQHMPRHEQPGLWDETGASG